MSILVGVARGKNQSLIELAVARRGRSGAVRRKSSRGNVPKGEPRRGPRPIRVLVAEDNPIVQELLAAVLAEDTDFQAVGMAADADEAIELARSTQPDVALLDVRMPGGGGPRAAREIARVCPTARVVALSSMDDTESVHAMMSANAVGYVTKDMPMAEILTTIRRCADGSSVYAPSVAQDVVRQITDLSRRAEADRSEREARVARILELCKPGAITTVFQPIKSLNGGGVAMLEALSRFPNEQRMNPGECFVEASSVGLSVELDLAAIQTALAALRSAGDDTSAVSLNILPPTLVDPRLADVLDGFDPHRVVFELTEHAEVTDYDRARKAINTLRDRGARLAIDDAGSGYASLRHILDLMPDIIKLDISLARDIGNDMPRRALASGLISFAREIDAQIVAEGIETESELHTLRDLGAGLGQGYFLARPAPREELAID